MARCCCRGLVVLVLGMGGGRVRARTVKVVEDCSSAHGLRAVVWLSSCGSLVKASLAAAGMVMELEAAAGWMLEDGMDHDWRQGCRSQGCIRVACSGPILARPWPSPISPHWLLGMHLSGGTCSNMNDIDPPSSSHPSIQPGHPNFILRLWSSRATLASNVTGRIKGAGKNRKVRKKPGK